MAAVTGKIVARRGENAYLLDVGGGKGRIVDLEQGKIFQVLPIASIASRGQWTECSVSPAETRKIIARAQSGERVRNPLMEYDD